MIRIGVGYDFHQFAEGRRLMLGGVEIPFLRGLQGHSDADVVLHSICDALLGAAGKGDIGEHFPDSDEEYVYGQFPQPILNAGSAQQREVFFKANLLIAEIHKHLTNRYESSKGTGEEITAKIKEVDALLK